MEGMWNGEAEVEAEAIHAVSLQTSLDSHVWANAYLMFLEKPCDADSVEDLDEDCHDNNISDDGSQVMDDNSVEDAQPAQSAMRATECPRSIPGS